MTIEVEKAEITDEDVHNRLEESNALVDELARHMALTEARNGDLLGDFLASGVEVRLELFPWNCPGANCRSCRRRKGAPRR